MMQRDGEEIILLEQIIRREAVHTFSSNGTGVSWQSEDSDFIELSQNVVFDGVTFQAMNSGWGHSPNTLIDWPYEFAYSYKFYRIKKSADFQGPLKLSREHFLNLKSDVSIPDISIR